MGMLSDFFVATRTKALEYEFALLDEDTEALQSFHTRQHKGFTGLEVARLHALLLQKPFSVNEHAFEVISTEEQEGLTEALPDHLRDNLASLTAEGLADIAERWANAVKEESVFEPEYLVTVLQDLRELAALAKSKKKGVYLWYSI